MPRAVACRRAGRSVPSCLSSSSNVVPENVHRSFSGREWFGFVWLDPSRLPVGGLEQSSLERGSVGPRRCARRRPDTNPPRDRLLRPQRLERPRNEHVVRGFESSRPTIAEFDFVGALFHRAGGQPPRQPWSGLVDPECQSVQVFDAQPVGEVHLERSIRSTLFALNNNLYARSKFVKLRILVSAIRRWRGVCTLHERDAGERPHREGDSSEESSCCWPSSRDPGRMHVG